MYMVHANSMTFYNTLITGTRQKIFSGLAALRELNPCHYARWQSSDYKYLLFLLVSMELYLVTEIH